MNMAIVFPFPRPRGSVCQLNLGQSIDPLSVCVCPRFCKSCGRVDNCTYESPMSLRDCANHHVGDPFRERTARTGFLSAFVQAQALNRRGRTQHIILSASASISKGAEPIAECASMSSFRRTARWDGTLQGRGLSEFSGAEAEFIAECPSEVGSQIKTRRFCYF